MKNPIEGLSNLQQRVIVGVLGIGLFFGLIVSGLLATCILFSILILLCLFEFMGLSPTKVPIHLKLLASAFGFSFFVAAMGWMPMFFLLALPPLLMLFLVFIPVERPFEVASWLVLGVGYLVPCWFCMLQLGGACSENGLSATTLLGLFGLLWASDSGAYFAGRSLGKTKLLPRVSPKKTWEGLIGGWIAASALAYFLSSLQTPYSLMQWEILAASTTFFGTLGDLAESVLKRSLDVKDSGSILPGHGGILDRFDGLFVCAPVNLLLVNIFF